MGTIEPVDRAVGSGNKAVGAGSDVDDDFSLADHGGAESGQILTRTTFEFPEVQTFARAARAQPRGAPGRA